MPEVLENGGTVDLWAGWSVELPPACYDRNADGSWSAWGRDWALDVQIVEAAGLADGTPATAAQMLGDTGSQERIEGHGWLGACEILTEQDGDRPVYRMAASCAATNTLLSFWVSYLDAERGNFARGLVDGVIHCE